MTRHSTDETVKPLHSVPRYIALIKRHANSLTYRAMCFLLALCIQSVDLSLVLW